MTKLKLKGIKFEDLNVTKETFKELIGLLNIYLELPNDECISFDSSINKFESGQIIAFYHLLVHFDNKLYCFNLSFFSSNVFGDDLLFSCNNDITCDFSVDKLYESGILTPFDVEIEEQDNPEQPAEENKQSVELTLLECKLFEEHEKANDCYYIYIKKHDDNRASLELVKCNVLMDLILEADLYSKYTSWLISCIRA